MLRFILFKHKFLIVEILLPRASELIQNPATTTGGWCWVEPLLVVKMEEICKSQRGAI